MANTYRVYGIEEVREHHSLNVEAEDFRYDDARAKLVFVDGGDRMVVEHGFGPETRVEQTLPDGAYRVYGFPPRVNPSLRQSHRTFRVEPGFEGDHPVATVVADDYRYDRASGMILFTQWERGEVGRVPFGRGTQVVDVSGPRPERQLDDAHANPLSPLHHTYLVGECPRAGKTSEELDRAQLAQARAPGKHRNVVAETFGYNEREDRIVFYNAWGERVAESPFGPDTWVRREDVDGTILPESRENPKARA